MKSGRIIRWGAVMILGLSAAARASEISLSLSTGVFIARQKIYRELYGSGCPLSADVWIRLKPRFGVSAGLDWLQDKGSAKVIGQREEVYRLKFSRVTVPICVFYHLGLKAAYIRLGGGFCFHFYRESWKAADLRFQRKKISPRLFAAAEYAILRRLSLFGFLAYDVIPTDAGSPFVGRVNLGGFQIIGGVCIHFWKDRSADQKNR